MGRNVKVEKELSINVSKKMIFQAKYQVHKRSSHTMKNLIPPLVENRHFLDPTLFWIQILF